MRFNNRTKRLFLIDKFQKWGYDAITLNLNNQDNFKKISIELKKKVFNIYGTIWCW